MPSINKKSTIAVEGTGVKLKRKYRKKIKKTSKDTKEPHKKNVEINRRTKAPPVIINLNRKFLYSSTMLPIGLDENEPDSEGDNSPDWQKEYLSRRIDNNSDLNVGEKEIMKLWNRHLQEVNYSGGIHIPVITKYFIDKFGKEIAKKDLYRNFVLHLTNLFEHELLTDEEFNEYVLLMQLQMKNYSAGVIDKPSEKNGMCDEKAVKQQNFKPSTDSLMESSLRKCLSFMSKLNGVLDAELDNNDQEQWIYKKQKRKRSISKERKIKKG